ncbi:hypothetical protein [Maricaulis sp.]|uniref:hypothetical protein n=1 Tax=Maricaulis sp. TaxID=1486257 RepID=UPI002627CF8E|nr:hypothetical protein [Maricaulis sp.]
MNPGVLFLPTFRASTTAYILGLVVLAIFDFWRMKSGIMHLNGWAGALLVGFFVFSIHANRRAHAERGRALGLLPVVVGWVVSGIGAIVAFMPGVISAMRDFAAENGVDVEDDQAFAEAVQDPAFTDAFTAHIEANEAIGEAIVSSAQTGLYFGFWLTIVAFGIWFAQMKRRGGALEGMDDTPSLYQPAAVAPAAAPEPAASEEAPVQPAEESAPEPAEEPAAEAPAKPEPADEAQDADVPAAEADTDADAAAEDEPKKTD